MQWWEPWMSCHTECYHLRFRSRSTSFKIDRLHTVDTKVGTVRYLGCVTLLQSLGVKQLKVQSTASKKKQTKKKTDCICMSTKRVMRGTKWKRCRQSIICVPCFVWGWRGILFSRSLFLVEGAAEHCPDTWHIHSCWKGAGPNTNWHAKSQRKQEKLSPVGGLLFNISFVTRPKEQLGSRGCGRRTQWERRRLTEPSISHQKSKKEEGEEKKSAPKLDARADAPGSSDMLL